MCKRGLLAEVQDLKNIVRIKDDKIRDLTERLNQILTSNTNAKDFNMMNIELNDNKLQLDQGKKEIEKLKYHRRTPLKQINADKSVVSISKQKEMIAIPSKPLHIEKESKVNKIKLSLISNSSQNGRLFDSYTQTEDQEVFDETNEFSSEPYVESYDTRKAHPIVDESFDLRAGNVSLPPSSQVQCTEEEEEEEEEESRIYSSPIKIKSKSDPQASIVKDSQGFDDEDEILINLPTPQTTSKFRSNIPSGKSFSKCNLQLQTPSDNEAPMKRPKIKRSKPSEMMTLTTDLTHHPTLNRNWIIEDFKVNPKLNNNIPYAYEVVIRGKVRECLHGKTCDRCDKFYEMAGEVLDFEGPRWDNNDTSGPNFNIVTKTSRHKELWDRPETPPGIGDFDFPSTQKAKENREKSDLMIKRIAYERLYSALHDKRFIFRNEEFNKMVDNCNFKVDENIFVKYLKKS